MATVNVYTRSGTIDHRRTRAVLIANSASAIIIVRPHAVFRENQNASQLTIFSRCTRTRRFYRTASFSFFPRQRCFARTFFLRSVTLVRCTKLYPIDASFRAFVDFPGRSRPNREQSTQKIAFTTGKFVANVRYIFVFNGSKYGELGRVIL